MRPLRFRPPSRREVRAAVGILWLVDAALQAAPALFTADWWRTDLAQSVMGQPPAVNRSIFWAVNLIAGHAALWNSMFVAVQVAIGLCLALGKFERAAIAVSIPWALGIWWIGEGFGTLPTGFALPAAGSPGPVLLYPLLVALAWPTSPRHLRGASSDSDHLATVNWRGGATAWVILWAGQSFLQIPSAFPARQTLEANISEYSQGQPGWLQAIAHHTETLARHHPGALTATMVAAQVAVGFGVLYRPTRRAALGVGIAVSVVYWLTFQYLGGIAAGDATDPGTAPLVILLAIALWPPTGRNTIPGAAGAPSKRRTAVAAITPPAQLAHRGRHHSPASKAAVGAERLTCSSISRPASVEATVCAGTTSTWAASPLIASTTPRCAACAA